MDIAFGLIGIDKVGILHAKVKPDVTATSSNVRGILHRVWLKWLNERAEEELKDEPATLDGYQMFGMTIRDIVDQVQKSASLQEMLEGSGITALWLDSAERPKERLWRIDDRV